jgi:broad specificity phosphatase PhoE
VRLLLIGHAAMGGGGRGGESAEAGLTEGARARAAEIGRLLPRPRVAFTSPSAVAVQTAQAIGLSATVASELREHDPDSESLDALIDRVGGWLGARRTDSGTSAAVTHVAIVRMAVVLAIAAPVEGASSIDVAPCSVTELSFRGDRWHLAHVNWEPALLHIPQRRGRRRPKASA